MQELNEKSAILDNMSSCLEALKDLDEKMTQYQANEQFTMKKVNDML